MNVMQRKKAAIRVEAMPEAEADEWILIHVGVVEKLMERFPVYPVLATTSWSAEGRVRHKPLR